jgi:hypothetical protein
LRANKDNQRAFDRADYFSAALGAKLVI